MERVRQLVSLAVGVALVALGTPSNALEPESPVVNESAAVIVSPFAIPRLHAAVAQTLRHSARGHGPATDGLAARDTRQSSWDAVAQVTASSRLVVAVAGDRTIRGEFFSADDAELVLVMTGNRLERVSRAEIVEIKILVKRDFDRVAKHVGPFAVIGLAAGAAVAASYCAKTHCNGQGWTVGLAAFGMVGALAGGGVGTIVALNREEVVSIYRAPHK